MKLTVKDIKGNATSAAKASFTAEGSIKWAVVGSAEAGAGFVNDVARVGDDGFDILSGGVAFWSNYDELTMVYEEITGDFDKTVQLVYQDPSSQWARVGLQARESLDEGKGRPDPDNACPAIRVSSIHRGRAPCMHPATPPRSTSRSGPAIPTRARRAICLRPCGAKNSTARLARSPRKPGSDIVHRQQVSTSRESTANGSP